MPHSREDLENQLKSIWIELLELDDVDGTDNFFDLGGDSLQAVEMVFLARDIGISMEVRDLFTTESLEDLVAAIRPAA